MNLGALVPTGKVPGMRGLGCAASYNFPFDCNTDGYYLTPSCWVFDRQHWADVCALQGSYTDVPDPDSSWLPSWMIPVALGAVALLFVLPELTAAMAVSRSSGRRRRR